MDEYWAQERIKLYEQFCIKHQISSSINEIDYNKKTREEVLKNGRNNLEI